jgi:hypothetical protein
VLGRVHLLVGGRVLRVLLTSRALTAVTRASVKASPAALMLAMAVPPSHASQCLSAVLPVARYSPTMRCWSGVTSGT